jgi:hypothetical protein
MKLIIRPVDVKRNQEPGPLPEISYEGIMNIDVEKAYTGIGFHTSVGTFGVCERDWGLEIKKPDGTTVRVQVEQK